MHTVEVRFFKTTPTPGFSPPASISTVFTSVSPPTMFPVMYTTSPTSTLALQLARKKVAPGLIRLEAAEAADKRTFLFSQYLF
jgi:hypothetical protein